MKFSEPWNSKCGKQRCTADEEDIRELELSTIMASSQLSIFVFHIWNSMALSTS